MKILIKILTKSNLLNIIYINKSMKPTDQKGQKPTVAAKTAKKVGKYTINFTKKLGKGQYGAVYAAENN
jgi:hypothetical protein